MARRRAPRWSGSSAIWGRVLLVAAALVLLALLAPPGSSARPAGPTPPRDGGRDPPPSPCSRSTPAASSVEDEYLSEGLSEEIIDRLAQVEGLKVISPASVVALKGRRLTVRQVADTLDVRHVLDGSLERAGRAHPGPGAAYRRASGLVVWQQTYRLAAPRAAPAAGRDRAAGGRRPAHDRRPQPMPAAPVRTAQVAGVRRVSQGRLLARAAHARRHSAWRTRPSRQAVELDSDYPQALAGLASAHTYAVIYGYRSEADPYNELAEALQLAERAIARDSAAAEGWLARADARSIAFFPEDSVRADVLRARS